MRSQCQTDWFLDFQNCFIFQNASYISREILYFCSKIVVVLAEPNYFSVCFCFQWMLKSSKIAAFHSPSSSTYIFAHGLKWIAFRFFNHSGLSLLIANYSKCFRDCRAFLMLNEKSCCSPWKLHCFEALQTVHSNTCSQSCSCFDSCFF